MPEDEIYSDASTVVVTCAQGLTVLHRGREYADKVGSQTPGVGSSGKVPGSNVCSHFYQVAAFYNHSSL